MNQRVALVFSALAALLFPAAFSSALSTSDVIEPAGQTELGPIFLLSLGGKLYDDLWPVLDQPPPAGRNAAVAADDAVEDRATWRCVTCHGWSYSGTGIGGASVNLRELAGVDADEVKLRILNPAHPFPTEAIPDLALDLLAFFIRDGLYDPANLLDEDGRAIGSAEAGQKVFEGACINCHQLDGRRFLKGERGDRSSLGWIARSRPEQALHKIINGVPAAEMLSLRFLPQDMIADLFAYLQTLDSEKP
jgi:mono/diheme cytochrome c family protein